MIFATPFLIFTVVGSEKPTIIEGQELTEFDGKSLSSINDFVENSISGPQNLDIKNYTLSITGLVEQKLNYTYYDIVTNFKTQKKVIKMTCIEGWSVTILWEGVLVEEIIEEAKVHSDATEVIFFASDGYFSSLSLDYILRNNIMIAYKMNNVTIPPERGFPFQLVAEGEMGDKWTKWITEIRLSNEEYQGWWDSLGAPSNSDFNSETIPEFPSWIVLPLFLVASVVVILYRKKMKL